MRCRPVGGATSRREGASRRAQRFTKKRPNASSVQPYRSAYSSSRAGRGAKPSQKSPSRLPRIVRHAQSSALTLDPVAPHVIGNVHSVEVTEGTASFYALVVMLAALVLALLFVTARRRRAFRTEMERWRARHPVGPDGIVPGAGPIALDAGERAAVLVHGFGDTPQTLERLAHALHAQGWTVRAPLLPGHGRTLEEFHASRGAEWTAAAREAFEQLRARHPAVAIVGLSMGGALATSLAASVGDRAATLALLAPFLEVAPSGRFLTAMWPVWAIWRAWVPGDAASAIHDPAARAKSLGYGVSSPRALRELRGIVDDASQASRQLQIPTLVVHSRTDYRIPHAAAERAFARLAAPEKELRWVERSGHVITVDRDAEAVIAMVIAWLERHVPAHDASRRDGSGEASAAQEPR